MLHYGEQSQRRMGPVQTPETLWTSVFLPAKQVQRGKCLAQQRLEVTVDLNSGFVSVMFYLNLPFGLVHHITNQGDYFNFAIILPSAAQVVWCAVILEFSFPLRILA